MIIQSLLDTDLYKFTMMQVVLHHFPGAQVEYKFRCRTAGVDLRPDVEAIRAELTQLYRLRFTDAELANLTLVVATINAWNRFGISFRDEPGHYTPKKHQ